MPGESGRSLLLLRRRQSRPPSLATQVSSYVRTGVLRVEELISLGEQGARSASVMALHLGLTSTSPRRSGGLRLPATILDHQSVATRRDQVEADSSARQYGVPQQARQLRGYRMSPSGRQSSRNRRAGARTSCLSAVTSTCRYCRRGHRNNWLRRTRKPRPEPRRMALRVHRHCSRLCCPRDPRRAATGLAS
jgi:hypothetical protein